MPLRSCVRLVPLAMLLLSGTACTATDDASPSPFTIITSPQFVNRVIPGHRPLALIEVTGGAGSAVVLSASATLDGADISIEPSSVDLDDGDGVAEVWVDLPEVVDETPVTVRIDARRGDLQQTATFDFTAVPGSDDVADQAAEIASVFLTELAGEVPGLPSDPADLVKGTPVAGLLVVTHYAWFTDEAEIGLAWHIMIAPDDFAELYVRPRDALAPTQAFRIGSWSTALAGGDVSVTEVDPPPEVTR